jgi:hypothetical protein
MLTTNLKKGQEIQGFVITKVTALVELNAVLFQLQHIKTGARMVHLGSQDPNNLFAVGFRTPPADSTGVAHVLEHTVLCGSRRYPVHDPFFTMIKRSLNTFMNAMTSSDWTLYPYASQNRKDFYNLMEIYLDAAFFPLLRERDFRQEGHRIEFAEMDNPESPLVFKGVVYNEMKGAMADPSSLLHRRLAKALYPTTCYRHNSGGEPANIPDLTWDKLRAFHANYYHPSNAYFFTYGDLPLEKHLEIIEQQALRNFSAKKIKSEVSLETRFSAPRRVTENFPLDPGESTDKRSMVQLAWLTCDIANSFERLALNLLSSLLLGNPAAPLYKALLDSGLGSNLAPGTGYQDENRTTYFAAGLQGTNPEETERIEELILATLKEVAQTGFSKERIEGAIHRLEFTHKEITGDHYPYPLALLLRILGPWLHCGDPESPLKLDENLARLRREIAAGPFFENLIRRHLLGNPHRVILTLKPDLAQKKQEEEATFAKLEKIRAALTNEAKKRIVDQARELLQAQEAREDLSCLPTLKREDIPVEEPRVPSDLSWEGNHRVQWHDQPTNDIGYFIAHLPANDLSEDMLPYVPLFCALLTQIGAAGHSYLEMARRMEAGTGGIQVGTEVLEHPENLTEFQRVVQIKGKALIRNQDQLFSILSDLCNAPDFTDLTRLHTVIGQLKINLENSIPASGHTYAARAGAGRLTAAAQQRESWSGLTQVRLIRKVAALQTEELKEISRRLQDIAQALLARNLIHCAMTAEKRSFMPIRSVLRPYLSGLPERGSLTSAEREPFTAHPAKLGWAASVPVSYVAQVFRAVPYIHSDAASLMVLAKLMRSCYLHREIREKGGAYGGLAAYDSEAGIFSMLSYRDPQLVRTLKVYDEATRWVVAGDFNGEEITEAILAVFSDLDRPLSPGGRGNREFINTRQGQTMAMRQQLRERVLAVDQESLVAVAAKYLQNGQQESTVSVIASEEALCEANKELMGEKLKIERI